VRTALTRPVRGAIVLVAGVALVGAGVFISLPPSDSATVRLTYWLPRNSWGFGTSTFTVTHVRNNTATVHRYGVFAVLTMQPMPMPLGPEQPLTSHWNEIPQGLPVGH